MKWILIMIFSWFDLFICHGQTIHTRYSVLFRSGQVAIDAGYRDNAKALADIKKAFTPSGVYYIDSVRIEGHASLEGPDPLNKKMSLERAESLREYIRCHFPQISEDRIQTISLGFDWGGLRDLVSKDYKVPMREKILWCIDHMPNEVNHLHQITRKSRIMSLGKPTWTYLINNIFPNLRYGAYITVAYKKKVSGTLEIVNPVIYYSEKSKIQDSLQSLSSVNWQDHGLGMAPVILNERHRPFYVALKTNLLYQSLLIPNIGFEFYVAHHWSIASNWMYAWWKNDHRHNYWRTYGGDLEFRYWFGKEGLSEHFSGWHVGAYGQILTYDFELGGKGYLGDRWTYGGGVSCGYSHPLARRWNIDFTVGAGFLLGKYKKYLPVKDHYVWQSTNKRCWIGPTKGEISLVWLMGKNNYNRQKGEHR